MKEGRYNTTENEYGNFYGKMVKHVNKTSSGGRTYGKIILPDSWIGRRVMVLLLDKPESETPEKNTQIEEK